MRIRSAALGTVLAWSTLSAGAHADEWRLPRRDAQRTASASGPLAFANPTAMWRAYMGGRPSSLSAHFRATSKVVLAASGGRIIAKHLVSQSELWQSELLGDPSVVDVVDLDGSGTLEVVVRTTPAAYVLDYLTGKVLWRSPPVQFEFVARVRVADLDGDGLPDVYVDECAACGKAGQAVAGAFSFKGGAAAGVPLWIRAATATPPSRHSGTDRILDLDSNGVSEVALGSLGALVVIDAKSGAEIAQLTHPTSPHFFTQAVTWEAELDGNPGKELVVCQSEGQLNMAGPPGMAAFRLDPKSGSWSLLWTAQPGGFDAEVLNLADAISDIDGDGRDEVVSSFRKSASDVTWTTQVLDGATGAVRAEISGARFEGAAELAGQPGAELVVATPQGLRAYGASGSSVLPITDVLPGVRAFTVSDESLRHEGEGYRRLALLERKPKPNRLLVGEPAGGSALTTLPAVTRFRNATQVSIASAGWVSEESYQPLVGQITEAIPANHTTRPYEQVAMGTTAGTLDVLDSKMVVTNGIVKVFGQRIGTVVGGNDAPLRGGTLTAADALGPYVALPEHPLGLLVGDARLASWIVPPLPRWIAPNGYAPSAISLGALGESIVGVEGQSLVARRTADGGEIGKLDMGPGIPSSAPMPISAGNGVPLVGIDWRIAGVQAVQHAVDFATLSEPWSAQPLPFGGFFGSSVGDLDQDGIDEWYSMNGPLNRRNVLTGAVTTFPAISTGYSLPMISSFNGPARQLLLQAGANSPKLVAANMSLVWAAETPEPMYVTAGTRTQCTSGARFVSPALNSPVLRAYDGSTGVIVSARVFASGKSYPSAAAAVADGARPGFLSNASSVGAGSSSPVVLVGSTDGWLYGVDGCTLDLKWSFDFGAPVGEASVGDYDADGQDEVIVGTSRGFVYGLDAPGLPSPAGIWIGDLSSLGLLEVGPGAAVQVSWAPVPGASSYEVSLVTPDETPMWDPPYVEVTGTEYQVPTSGALASRPYRIAVRAIGVGGKSPDLISAPVVVVDDQPPSLVLSGGLSGKTVALSLEATDNLALDYYVATWRADGAADEVWADGVLAGPTGSIDLAWQADSAAWGKSGVIAIRAFDSAGQASELAINAKIHDDGTIVLLSSSNSVDGPPTVWGQAPDHEGSGPLLRPHGGCAASGAGAGSSRWVLALSLLALGSFLIRRRNR